MLLYPHKNGVKKITAELGPSKCPVPTFRLCLTSLYSDLARKQRSWRDVADVRIAGDRVHPEDAVKPLHSPFFLSSAAEDFQPIRTVAPRRCYFDGHEPP